MDGHGLHLGIPWPSLLGSGLAFFSFGLGYADLVLGGVVSLFLFGIFPSFLLFSCPWGSRCARPWGWLCGVSFLFLFLYATFHGWTY